MAARPSASARYVLEIMMDGLIGLDEWEEERKKEGGAAYLEGFDVARSGIS